MKIIILSAILLLLFGCSMEPTAIQSNSVSLTSIKTFERKKTVQLAEEHCAKYEKIAKLTEVHGFIMTFECVKTQIDDE